MDYKNLITLTTDFGDQFAVAQLHAVLARRLHFWAATGPWSSR